MSDPITPSPASDSRSSLTKRKYAQVTEASEGVNERTEWYTTTGQRPLDQPETDILEAIEWPEFFQFLEKIQKALNLVYTFCSSRKHMATTFSTIRPAVATHIKRDLEITDVAAVVCLRPEGIRFLYVDKVKIDSEIRGSDRDRVFMTSSTGQTIVPDDSVGGISGRDSLRATHDDDEHTEKEVLYFEYVDGDLNRHVPDRKTGEPVRAQRKLKDENLRLPVYSPKEMTALIERRNSKFKTAIDVFLRKCMSEQVDPVAAIKSLAQEFIPKKAEVEQQKTSSIPRTIPKERQPIAVIVQELKESPWYTGQIVPDGHRVFEPQEPVFGELDFLLSQNLVNAIYNAKGITQFYAHQAEAINSLHHGLNVVVSTSTSSGKSLIYQLPVLYELERNPEARAMYIFPTKALAQDQKRSLKDLVRYMPGLEGTLVETFDGDTPMSERNHIREEASIIFTNPDMLHVTILPQEERWRSFLKSLRYVVG